MVRTAQEALFFTSRLSFDYCGVIFRFGEDSVEEMVKPLFIITRREPLLELIYMCAKVDWCLDNVPPSLNPRCLDVGTGELFPRLLLHRSLGSESQH